MDQYNDPIGTGQTYTTIASWETARGNDASAWTGDHRGRCLAEAFSETVSLENDDTGAAYFLILTADSGAEHDGRAHEVSAAGNARNVLATSSVITLVDQRIEVSWMELQNTVSSGINRNCVYSLGFIPDLIIHHNILHCNVDSSTYGMRCTNLDNDDQSDLLRFYRNISYGAGDPDLCELDGNGIHILHNTNGPSTVESFDLGNVSSTNNSIVENNAAFTDNAQTCYNIDASATKDNNASEDATGDAGAGLTGLTATDQFTNFTDTFTSTDLTIKDAAADIYQAGDAVYSTVTYPEINVPISDRTAVITGTWSVGADDFNGGGGARIFDFMPFFMNTAFAR